jgi:hypothetical protein
MGKKADEMQQWLAELRRELLDVQNQKFALVHRKLDRLLEGIQQGRDFQDTVARNLNIMGGRVDELKKTIETAPKITVLDRKRSR